MLRDTLQMAKGHKALELQMRMSSWNKEQTLDSEQLSAGQHSKPIGRKYSSPLW